MSTRAWADAPELGCAQN